MSYASVFKTGGDPYRVWSEVIDQLANGLQNAARKVFGCIVRKELDGKLDTEKPTDGDIGRECGLAPRTVQKALHALDTDVLQVNDGRPLIHRDSGLGCHGRRTITLTVGLAKSRDDRQPAGGPPPQTPLEEKTKNTTTEGGSSSSPEKGLEKAPEPTDPAIAALIDRACKLIPEATPGKVLDAVSVYGADWVSQALDVAERRPKRKDGNKPVYSWGFVLGTLKNWRREGGPPPEKPTPAQPAAVPKAPAEPAAPAPKLLPEQLAELLAQARQRGILGRLAATQIRMAAAEGRVPPELLATVPAELLVAPEVAAPGSS
jgi:hypothetical protein